MTARRHVATDAKFAAKAVIVSAAAVIPVVGTPVSTAIGIWEGERVSRRVKKLLDEVAQLQARVARLEDVQFDTTYADSEAFEDAAISAVQAAKRTSTKRKREWIAAALVGAATSARPMELDVEAILDTLGGLTEREFEILASAWRSLDAQDSFFAGIAPTELRGPDYNFHLLRLQSAGLIAQREDLPAIGTGDWRTYQITATFRRLMQLISVAGELSA